MQLTEWFPETNVDELPEQLRSDPKTQRHQALLRESKRLCATVLEVIHRDVISARRALPPLPKGSSQSTLGLMLNGCNVENALIGGPAMVAGLERGDAIVQVNGKDTNAENILQLLHDDDTPGSQVPLSIRKRGTGRQEEIAVERIPTASVLDRVKLFRLFVHQENVIRHLHHHHHPSSHHHHHHHHLHAEPGAAQASRQLKELESTTQQAFATWTKMVVSSLSEWCARVRQCALLTSDNIYYTQVMDQESEQKQLKERVLKAQEEGLNAQKSSTADSWRGPFPMKPLPLPP